MQYVEMNRNYSNAFMTQLSVFLQKNGSTEFLQIIYRRKKYLTEIY